MHNARTLSYLRNYFYKDFDRWSGVHGQVLIKIITNSSMSTVEDLSKNEEIHYQVRSTSDAVIGVSVAAVLFLAVLGMTIASGEFGPDNILLYIVSGAFGLVLVLSIRNAINGVREITITQNEIVLEYKEKTEHVSISEISHINTMVFNKNKRKAKGAVFFKVYQETKKGLTFSLRKPGGKEAFDWFERLKESQKNKV
jgi:hypothetical protein